MKLHNRILSAALCCLLLAGMPVPALAADASIIHIRSTEDFLEFAENCAYDAWSKDKTVVLEKDISLSGADYRPAGAFGGTLNGQGHTISGLEITERLSPAGLFGTILPEGRVQGLNVEGVVAPEGSASRVGGVAGVNRGRISNCSFSGTVRGERMTGGICGENAAGGAVRLCDVNGGVFGTSMTGGVAGKNSGTLSGCANRAYVNTDTVDPEVSLPELNFDPLSGIRRLTSPDTYNVATDSGGIAGYSDGSINGSRNYGTVGYQHIGYNVGGVVGRSSGFLDGCSNFGQVNARKDVGGVVGLAEPYVIIRLTGSSIDAVRQELDRLSALVEQAANDASGSSDSISARLTAIGDSINAAEDRARDLTDGIRNAVQDAENFVNDAMDEVNRGSSVLDGALPLLRDTAGDLELSSDLLTGALDQMDKAMEELNASGAFDALEGAAGDLENASEEADRMMQRLRSFVHTLQNGISQVRRGLETLEGTIHPKDGMSRAEWDATLHEGYTETIEHEDGTTEEVQHEGSLTELRTGADETLRGITAVTGILSGMTVLMEEQRWSEIPDYIRDSGLSNAMAAMGEGVQTMNTGLTKTLDVTEFDSAIARQGMGQISDGLGTMAGAGFDSSTGMFSDLASAMERLGTVAAALGDASDSLQPGLTGLRDAMAQMTEGIRDAESLVDYFDKQDPLHFDPLDVAGVGDQSDAFYDALHGVSNQMELLNGETKGAGDRLVDDLRRINNQFTALMNTVLGVVDDAGSIGSEELVQDTSDEDIEAAVSGKVRNCANSGAVGGDINVGGVAGSMQVYNELNPEEDDRVTLSSLVRRTYQLKCILQGCVNTGEITAKRNNAGAVCGDAQLGVIAGCEAYGSVKSEGGDYVGGLAGRGDALIRACWSKCALSGRNYVGGIVGGGLEDNSNLRVENCSSLVEIGTDSRYTGAISGLDTGSFSGNRFVSDTLSGVNRSSAAGQAEPVRYETLRDDPNTPAAFREFTLRFVTEEGKTVKSLRFSYGDSFDESVFPDIAVGEGNYAVWDRTDLTDLRFDTTVTATSAKDVTALDSAVTRSASRPVFFVQGSFTADDALMASTKQMDFSVDRSNLLDRLRSYRRTLLEQWTIQIPSDGAESHSLRYLPPRTASDALELYILENGAWRIVETEAVGSYLRFDAPGNEVLLTVVSTATPWWVWAIVGVFLLNAALFFAVLLIRKKPKTADTADEKASAARSKRLRKRFLLGLLAGMVALGTVAGAVLYFAPALSGLELYNLLHSYEESPELDMELSLSLTLPEERYAGRGPLFVTTRDKNRISCIRWAEIPFYSCQGALLLSDGSSYRTDGALPDYTALPETVAKLFRSLETTREDRNGVTVYRADANSAAARQQLEAYLPHFGTDFPAPEAVSVEFEVTDGEPTVLRVDWRSGAAEATAALKLSGVEWDHSLPQPVRAAVAAEEHRNAAPLSPEKLELIYAWAELSAAEPLSADTVLTADCGPLLTDETLTWQWSHSLAQDLSRLDRRDATVFFTDTAACSGSGLAIPMNDKARTDLPLLLRSAFEAILLGSGSYAPTDSGGTWTLRPDGETMRALTAVVAPEAAAMDLSFKDGTLTLELQNGRITALSFHAGGTLLVVRSNVGATVSAELRFRRGAVWQTVPDAVLDALSLAE